MTRHSLVEDDRRDLSFIEAGSVDLVVTHPPCYGTLDEEPALGQLSGMCAYDDYLASLDAVWEECERVLATGGVIACVASALATHDRELPEAADVSMQLRGRDFRPVRSIRWVESDDVLADEARLFGQANQPCGDARWDGQEIVVLRKPGARRFAAPEIQVASRIPADYFAACASAFWVLPPDSGGHPHAFPFELAERLIRMYSYAGDTVLDPFAGAGTTSDAARRLGRRSIAVKVEQRHFGAIRDRLSGEWPAGEIHIERRADRAVARRGTRAPA